MKDKAAIGLFALSRPEVRPFADAQIDVLRGFACFCGLGAFGDADAVRGRRRCGRRCRGEKQHGEVNDLHDDFGLLVRILSSLLF